MSDDRKRNELAPKGSVGVEPVQQGLLWNDPAAYEAVQSLQQVDPQIGQYLYNPETRMFHPVYPVDYDPFNPSSGQPDEESDDVE